MTVHRFRRDRGGHLWFQGDANPHADIPIPAALLVGRVAAVEVNGRSHRLGPLATVWGRLKLDVQAAGRRIRRV